MNIAITSISERSKLVELIAQNSATYECLGYSKSEEPYNGSVAGFEQRYRPGRVSFSSLAELEADYQRYLDSEFSSLVESHCQEITAKREALNTSLDAVAFAHGVQWQADPKSLEKLNNALTTYTPFGALPPGFKWWDAENNPHDADLRFLAEIAAADAERQYLNFVTSVQLKEQARALVPRPGCIGELAEISWPVLSN